MSLNRYDHENTKSKIIGYMVGRHPTETHEQEFNKAKTELLQQLRLQITRVEGFSYSDLSKKVS